MGTVPKKVKKITAPHLSVQWIDAAEATHSHVSLNTLRSCLSRSPSSSGARNRHTCNGVCAWKEHAMCPNHLKRLVGRVFWGYLHQKFDQYAALFLNLLSKTLFQTILGGFTNCLRKSFPLLPFRVYESYFQNGLIFTANSELFTRT